MSYDFKTMGHEYHAHHGPQPDGEALDNSWLTEVDKFLKGEENKLKEHKNFVNYKYEYLDKSFPSVEAVHDLFHAPLAPPAPKYWKLAANLTLFKSLFSIYNDLIFY